MKKVYQVFSSFLSSYVEYCKFHILQTSEVLLYLKRIRLETPVSLSLEFYEGGVTFLSLGSLPTSHYISQATSSVSDILCYFYIGSHYLCNFTYLNLVPILGSRRILTKAECGSRTTLGDLLHCLISYLTLGSLSLPAPQFSHL